MTAARSTVALVKILVVLFLFSAVAGGLGLAFALRTLEKPFQGFPFPETVVTVPPGTSAREGLNLLEREGVIASQRLARLYWRFALEDPVLIAGEYRFRGPASIPNILGKITRGEVLTHPVTILEGLTFDEIARHLSTTGFGTYEAFLSEMTSPRLIEDLDPIATDLEGYLFPDTYAFARGTSEARIVETLVAGFRERFLQARAMVAAGTNNDSGHDQMRTPREVVVLASIVEKEALQDQERPIIAGVYANRLERGMGLYADPTIIYALKRQGTWDGNLRRRDLEMDSPYNTYRTAGLPPGPICSPGLASLAAAMDPADVPYLYFVSRNDGTHVFAQTLSEHNRNVYEWQKLYWQRRWAVKSENAEGEKLH